MQEWLNIHKSIKVMHDRNRIKNKPHGFINRRTRNLEKLKCCLNVNTEESRYIRPYFDTIKARYKYIPVNILLNGKKLIGFTLKLAMRKDVHSYYFCLI